MGGGTQDNGVIIRNNVWLHKIGGDVGRRLSIGKIPEIWVLQVLSSPGVMKRYLSRQTGVGFSSFVSIEPYNEYEPYPFRQNPINHLELHVARKNKFYKISSSGVSSLLYLFPPPNLGFRNVSDV
ncbi:MAG: hypothetical protein R3C61_00015 [Bacteroidia bacterium]